MKLLLTTTIVTLVTFAAGSTVTAKPPVCNFLDSNGNPPSYLSMYAINPSSSSVTSTYLDLPLTAANVNTACSNLTNAIKNYSGIRCDANVTDQNQYSSYQFYGQALQDYSYMCSATTKPAVLTCIGIVFNTTNSCSANDIPLASYDTGCALIGEFGLCVMNQLLTKCKSYAAAVSASSYISENLYSYNDNGCSSYYYD